MIKGKYGAVFRINGRVLAAAHQRAVKERRTVKAVIEKAVEFYLAATKVEANP